MQKIHDGVAMRQQAVGEVADDAAEDEAERELAENAMRAEMSSRNPQHDERDERDGGEEKIIAGEHTPRGAGVFAVREVEAAGDDGDFIAVENFHQHEPFGELVERKDERGQRKDAAAGLGQNGIVGRHKGQFQVSGLKFQV